MSWLAHAIVAVLTTTIVHGQLSCALSSSVTAPFTPECLDDPTFILPNGESCRKATDKYCGNADVRKACPRKCGECDFNEENECFDDPEFVDHKAETCYDWMFWIEKDSDRNCDAETDLDKQKLLKKACRKTCKVCTPKAKYYPILKKTIEMENIELEVIYHYEPGMTAYSTCMLNGFAKMVKNIERWSGVPFPGQNPYPIHELYYWPKDGTAGPSNMRLNSIPHYWTMAHEMVHIWNAGSKPKWVTEGLADFVGYWTMEKVGLIYEEDYPKWSMEAYIEEWWAEKVAGGDYDIQDYVYSGKMMEFWSIIYQLYGPDFIAHILKRKTDDSCNDDACHESQAIAYMCNYLRSKQGVKSDDCKALFTGWVTEGPYTYSRWTTLTNAKFYLSGGSCKNPSSCGGGRTSISGGDKTSISGAKTRSDESTSGSAEESTSGSVGISSGLVAHVLVALVGLCIIR